MIQIYSLFVEIQQEFEFFFRKRLALDIEPDGMGAISQIKIQNTDIKEISILDFVSNKNASVERRLYTQDRSADHHRHRVLQVNRKVPLQICSFEDIRLHP